MTGLPSINQFLSNFDELFFFVEENQRQLEFYKKRGLPVPNGDLQCEWRNFVMSQKQLYEPSRGKTNNVVSEQV